MAVDSSNVLFAQCVCCTGRYVLVLFVGFSGSVCHARLLAYLTSHPPLVLTGAHPFPSSTHRVFIPLLYPFSFSRVMARTLNYTVVSSIHFTRLSRFLMSSYGIPQPHLPFSAHSQGPFPMGPPPPVCL